MDTSLTSLQQILRTAIQREIEANALYNRAAETVKAPEARDLLRDLALQELGHRHRLEALLEGNLWVALSEAQARKVQDLKITDYLIEVPLTAEASIQDILIVAGKREAGSHALYAGLAQVAEADEARRLFEFLAAEELMHKQRIEALYERLFYAEN